MSDFGAELARWMAVRGVGVRELRRRSGYSAGYVTQLRQGRRFPSPDVARDLDDALGAGGALAASRAGRVPGPAVEEGLPRADSDELAAVLAGHGAGAGEPPGTVTALAALVDAARGDYQACRYVQLGGILPGLVRKLEAACSAFGGAERDRSRALLADAYHVTAGVLLKHGDLGLAALAADRSMRAALASEDPVAVGGSARIVTHALMSGGHLRTAVSAAADYAGALSRDVPKPTPGALSVYGALLLRGAVAAAHDDNRRSAYELLGEAEEAAGRLGADANHHWTAFGPINARLHRVSIAVTLGDAGTALDLARSIDPAAVTVTERRATLLIDTARACLQRGRHESAYEALRAAHRAAPEEVAGRSAVRALVRDLASTAPPTVRRDAARFAASIGASIGAAR
jgi:transcriptional regulator with XRE-family HTH domain